MSKEEGGGGGDAQAQYVGPYRLEKTLGKGQTGECSSTQKGQDLVEKTEAEYQGWQSIIRRLWIGVKDGSGPSGREGGSIVVTSVSDEPGQLTQLRLTGPSTGVITNNQQCNFIKQHKAFLMDLNNYYNPYLTQ